MGKTKGERELFWREREVVMWDGEMEGSDLLRVSLLRDIEIARKEGENKEFDILTQWGDLDDKLRGRNRSWYLTA